MFLLRVYVQENVTCLVLVCLDSINSTRRGGSLVFTNYYASSAQIALRDNERKKSHRTTCAWSSRHLAPFEYQKKTSRQGKHFGTEVQLDVD